MQHLQLIMSSQLVMCLAVRNVLAGRILILCRLGLRPQVALTHGGMGQATFSRMHTLVMID